MKKLLIAIAAAATAIGTYAATAIGGAGFDTADTADKYSWTEAGGFSSSTWVGAGADGVMTRQTTGMSGFTADARPAGYNSKNDDGFMSLKTTFGNPVTQYANEGSIQRIGDGFYYDGLVKFTACDETPDLTAAAYDGAKIGFFPLLESDEDGADAYLYIWSAGGTNLWKTTEKIDDQWHRVTIKMIANANKTGAAQPAFVVFVDGNAVNCTDAKAVFTEANLTPVAKKWWTDGALFASLTASTEVTGVLYDGQGAIDEVGFADVAPDFAADAQYFSVTYDKTIETLYLVGPDGTITPASGEDIELKAGEWKYYYTAVAGYISVPEGEAKPFTPAKDTAFNVPAATEAKVYVNETPFATLTEAVAALKGDATITFAGAYDASGETIAIANTGVTTIDLGGKQIKADLTVNSALVVTNSVDMKTADLYDGQLVGDVTIAEDVAVEIYGGYINGEWQAQGDAAVAFGGQFSFEVGGFLAAVEPAEGFEAKVVVEDELWEVVPVQVVEAEVTINAGDNLTLTVATEDGTIIESGDMVEVGTELTITATPDEYYTLASLKVNDADFTSGSTYAVESGDPITIAATASATVWTITYIDNGDEVGSDAYSVADRATKELLTLDPKAGYTFDGWYDANQVKVESLAEKTGDLTLTAKWTKDLIDLKDAVIALSAEKVAEGDTLPTITGVTLAGQALTADQDYTVTAPTEVGAAGTVLTWTITGKGDYTGTASTNLTVEAAAVDPVVPGEEIKTDKTPAEINEDPTIKATLLKAPDGATVDAAVYNTYFDAVAGATPGTVKFELNAAGEAALQANANSEIIKIKPSEIAALTTESGKFKVETTLPGFYYAVKQGNGIGNMKVVAAGVLATDAKGVELDFVKYNGAGFYKIVVSPTPIKPED